MALWWPCSIVATCAPSLFDFAAVPVQTTLKWGSRCQQFYQMVPGHDWPLCRTIKRDDADSTYATLAERDNVYCMCIPQMMTMKFVLSCSLAGTYLVNVCTVIPRAIQSVLYGFLIYMYFCAVASHGYRSSRSTITRKV